MTATPMTLEDALRLSGYTIDTYESSGRAITTASGTIAVPPMILSRLTWRHADAPSLGSAFYLDKLPAFHTDYAPVQLSLILDRFRSRRLGYDTPDEFGLAVRRWGALHLGAMSTLTRRYLSTATDLPLDTVNLTLHTESSGESTAEGTSTGTASDNVTSSDTTNSTTKGRDAQSEFPQGMLAGNTDYASGAVDSVGSGNVAGTGSTEADREQSTEDTRNTTENGEETRTEQGRSGRTVMELLAEQRAAFLNVDEELLDGMESLFLGVFDRSDAERGGGSPFGYAPFGYAW